MIRKRNTRKNNKLMCLTAAVMILLFALGGCAGTDGQESRGKSLRDHGMDVISVMEEMVKSSDYADLMGNSADAVEEIRADLAAGDYASPLAVYEVSCPDIQDVLALTGGSGIMDGFSEGLRNHLNNRAASTLINLLNTRSGYASLAAASVYTAGKTFVCEKPQGNTLYLYTFENGYPITVTFTAGEDNSMTATGTFLILEDFDIQAAEQLMTLLKGFGFEGEIRQLP
ncbi:MAG: hypothetical protein K2G28_11520 [Acetatifactor sp.]|nr:hypothetical protein [Acetatifactor sp.]